MYMLDKLASKLPLNFLHLKAVQLVHCFKMKYSWTQVKNLATFVERFVLNIDVLAYAFIMGKFAISFSVSLRIYFLCLQ